AYWSQLAHRRKISVQVGLGFRIAVLSRRDRGHPRLGVLEEREEVDHAEEIDTGGEEIWIERDTDHRHVATVRAARNADALRVGNATGYKVIDAVLEILDAFHAQRPIVEIHEALSEPRRPAHVRREDTDTLRDECLIVAAEVGTLLAFGSSMKADDKWRGTGAAVGSIEPAAQPETVMRRERD